MDQESPLAEPETSSELVASGGWLEESLRRRVPQYVAVYLGGSFGILQFVSWVTERYLLSPHLPDLTLALLGFFVPSVLVHAWYHGAPGPDRWPRFEKGCIGANTLVAGVLMVFFFGGADLGRATTEVTLTDEAGTVTTRTVPKPELRRRVGLFAFEGPPGDHVAADLRDAIPWLIHMDLLQDLFIRTRLELGRNRVTSGPGDGVASPVARRAIALDHDLKHYVSGSIATVGPAYRLEVRLHESRRGILVAQDRFSGRNLFVLVDSATRRLKERLDIPSGHIQRTVDLPVEHLTTDDTRALALAVAGENALERQQWQEGVASLREAVRRDSTFAAAWGSLAAGYFVMNQTDSARNAVQNAMDYRSDLPERRRTSVKALHFTLQGDREKVLRLARMQVDLYPDDIQAHQELARELEAQGRWDEALHEHRTILRMDPDHSQSLRAMGRVLRRTGRTGEAIEAFERYVERRPQDVSGLLDLAALHVSTGELDEAQSLYDRAHVLQPDALRPVLGMADVARRKGDFEEARAEISRARSLASSLDDRKRVAMVESALHRMRGQVDSARLSLAPSFSEPGAIGLVNQIFSLGLEARAGQGEEAWRRLRAAEGGLQPPWDGAAHIGRLLIHRALGQPEETALSLEAARGALDFALGPQALESLYLAAEGDLLRWGNDCEGALPLYERSIEADRDQPEVWSAIVGCLQQNGRLDKARAWLERGLALVPAEPTFHVAMAHIERQTGDTAAALRHLRRALTVWEAADPDYAPAREARELRARWEGEVEETS